jgi:hypothetical protein
MIPGSSRNWIAVMAVQQASVNKKSKQMIAPLQLGRRHRSRRRMLATVDPRVGGCSHLTQFINNGDQLTRGQRSSARQTDSLPGDFQFAQGHREAPERVR